jgi:DNA-binding GntR family transcriptional regulator
VRDFLSAAFTALEADDLVAWARADGRFHQLLIEQCGNKRLARVYHTIMDQSHRARMLTIRLRPKPTGSVLEHRAIVGAIRQGDASEARERAKQHRARARDQLLPLLDQFGMWHL